MTLLRVFLAVVVHSGLCVRQGDVETAFLNGILKEAIYIKPPEGYRKNGVQALRLLKALYGLPQSPKCWYEKLKEMLLKCGFRICKVESCMFILKDKDSFIIILVYVDDFLIAGNSVTVVDDVISEMNNHFNVKVMDRISSFIGFHLNFQ